MKNILQWQLGLRRWAYPAFAAITLFEVWAVTVAPAAYRGLLSNITQTITSVGAGILLTRTALILRRQRNEIAGGWVPLAVSAWLSLAGMLIFTLMESVSGKSPYPGIPDLFFFSTYPLIMIGLSRMHRAPISTSDQWNNALDLSALGLIAAMMIWHLNLSPLINKLAQEITPVLLVSIAYTFADFLMLVVLFALLLRKSDQQQHFKSTLLLLIGVFWLVVSDLGQGYVSIDAPFASGSFLDIGWVLFGVFTSIAALEGTKGHAMNDAEKIQADILQSTSTTVITNIWIAASFSILVWAVFHPETRSSFLLAGTGAACVLAVVRQIRMVRENSRLYKSLHLARENLEKKVLDRTAQLATANATLLEEIEARSGIQTELEAQRSELLSEIEERKRMQSEVENVHRQLLDASRQAGMAEVATGVLHNVGNVLNSVNVSANLIADQLEVSLSANLARVSSLLDSHKSDLCSYLTIDPKGRRIPEFIAHLAISLDEERARNIREIHALQKNVEHIKEIVAMQQSYAKVAGINEDLSAADLVEDAMRMNEAAFQRHGISIRREFADVPLIRVDKHKVLQILVNLVRNAKYAISTSDCPDKVLTLGVNSNARQQVEIFVRDNGIGIAPENLTRIFSHGFTTKKDGHGFGLHIGALSAKEMGGSLQAYSDGPGKGATFVLELPVADKISTPGA